jgi:hypothetical protein
LQAFSDYFSKRCEADGLVGKEKISTPQNLIAICGSILIFVICRYILSTSLLIDGLNSFSKTAFERHSEFLRTSARQQHLLRCQIDFLPNAFQPSKKGGAP